MKPLAMKPLAMKPLVACLTGLLLLGASPTCPTSSEALHTLRVTSTSGAPAAFEAVRFELGGRDVRQGEVLRTPFEMATQSWDVSVVFSSEQQIKVELLRSGRTVLTGVGKRVVLDQGGRDETLRGRVQAYEE